MENKSNGLIPTMQTVFISCLFLLILNGAQGQTVCLQLSSGNDDIEEYGAGLQYFSSSDLEFVNDINRGDQIVGMRYNYLGIPQGASITEATIQFTADETTDISTNLTIHIEAVDHASPFSSTDYDLSSRPLSPASISWTPAPWTAGERTASQKTPDISSLIQEVVNRPGYTANSSIVIIIQGNGKRVAESFESSPSLAPELCITFQGLYASDLHINEVMASNGSTIADEYGEYDDWIEIYNSSPTAINLAGYYLSDDPASMDLYQIPTGSPDLTTVPAYGHLLIWADDDDEQGANHTNFKLSSSGETVFLSDGNGQLIDNLAFSAIPSDQSYGRTPDAGAVSVPFQTSTPEASNGSGQELVVPPSITPQGGIMSGPVQVTINSSTANTVIRYTTDGSAPTSSSNIYAGPITVAASTGLRAAVFHSSLGQSEIVTENYIFYSTDLPIISINMDPFDLWDNNNGMYVIGSNGIGGNCMPQVANFNNDWEKPANITMIETDGSVAFSTDAGISISGGCSRTAPQKSFNIAAKSVYGASHFEHQLFPDDPQDKFKRFKLRNGGNGFGRQTFSDPLTHLITQGEVDIDQQRVRPTVVFINGQYWGRMNIREAISEHYVNEHHDVDKDSIDLIYPSAAWGNAIEGTLDKYQELYHYFNDNDLSDPQHYEWAKANVDINEFINYMIVETYVGNTDWPGNNLKIWREQKEGAKWRWIMYDVDWGMGYTRSWTSSTQADHTTNTLALATHPTFVGWPFDYRRTMFLRKLLENDEFSAEFMQRYATQMGTIFEATRCQNICDQYRASIINEKPAHISRWHGTQDDRGYGISMSMNAFENEFNYTRSWFEVRQPYVKQHIRDYFNLGGMYTLSIPVNASTNGYVVLNQNEYRAPENYTAEYFDGVPMRIKAVADPGYQFSHWLENGDTNPEHIFTSSVDLTLTPVFIPGLPLLINELHYNPVNGPEEEFIEIVNTSDTPVQLQGVSFTNGIDYTFDTPFLLAGTNDYPNNYLVLAHDFAIFQNSNGFAPYGQYSGKLDNNGEKIVLEDAAGNIIDQVRYYDEAPWETTPDDGLHSLALLSHDCDNDLPECWSFQAAALTSPGKLNYPSLNCPADFTLDGVIDVADFLEFNTHYGINCGSCRYDLTGDGTVDVSDFLELNSYFGLSCPPE